MVAHTWGVAYGSNLPPRVFDPIDPMDPDSKRLKKAQNLVVFAFAYGGEIYPKSVAKIWRGGGVKLLRLIPRIGTKTLQIAITHP